MWLMSYMTGQSLTPPNAVWGDVRSSGSDGAAVLSSGEHKNVAYCLPYGFFSMPPTGERAVVLPLEDGEISLGVIAPRESLEPGELKLQSMGGASLVLKNDGRVLVNGREIMT